MKVNYYFVFVVNVKYWNEHLKFLHYLNVQKVLLLLIKWIGWPHLTQFGNQISKQMLNFLNNFFYQIIWPNLLIFPSTGGPGSVGFELARWGRGPKWDPLSWKRLRSNYATFELGSRPSKKLEPEKLVLYSLDQRGQTHIS